VGKLLLIIENQSNGLNCAAGMAAGFLAAEDPGRIKKAFDLILNPSPVLET
jgi:hypothetical protein